MSVSVFFACLSWFYIGLCCLSICIRIHVAFFPLKHDAEMREICRKPINSTGILFVLLVITYALWYKWGF